mmetsp:Transcript_30556/g.71359  ORF Transcript_30556/g.71359 Transcript_30556/m.71359 type:complete len:168 (-) Transcript_30556:174-677(-)
MSSASSEMLHSLKQTDLGDPCGRTFANLVGLSVFRVACEPCGLLGSVRSGYMGALKCWECKPPGWTGTDRRCFRTPPPDSLDLSLELLHAPDALPQLEVDEVTENRLVVINFCGRLSIVNSIKYSSCGDRLPLRLVESTEGRLPNECFFSTVREEPFWEEPVCEEPF